MRSSNASIRLVLLTIILGLILNCQSQQPKQNPVAPAETQATYREPTLETYKLANGLTVILFNHHRGDQAYVELKLNAGELRTPVDGSKNGLAHLFEHMILKGSALNPTPESFRQTIERLGGRKNASTYYNVTNYKLTINQKNLLDALPYHADLFVTPKLPEDFLQHEIHAVLNEVNIRNNNDAIRLTEDTLWLSTNPEISRPIAPTEEQIASFTRDDLQQFFETEYSADNMTLAISGNLDGLDQLKPVIETHYGRISARPRTKINRDYTVVQDNVFRKLRLGTSSATRLSSLYLKGPDIGSIDHIALNFIIDELVDTGRRGALRQYLYDNQLVKSFAVSVNRYENKSAINLEFEFTRKGYDEQQKVIQTALSWIKQIADFPITNKWLKSRIAFTKWSERKDFILARFYALTSAHYLTEYGMSIDEYMAKLATLTPDDIKRVINQYFTPLGGLYGVSETNLADGLEHPLTQRKYVIENESAWLKDTLQAIPDGLVKATVDLPQNPYVSLVRLEPLKLTTSAPTKTWSTAKQNQFLLGENHSIPNHTTTIMIQVNPDHTALGKHIMRQYENNLLYFLKDEINDLNEVGIFLETSFGPNTGQWGFSISGLPCEIDDVVARLLKRIQSFKVDPGIFEVKKLNNIDTYSTWRASSSATDWASALESQLIDRYTYGQNANLAAIEQLTPAMLQDFNARLFNQPSAVLITSYGDMTKTTLEQTATVIEKSITLTRPFKKFWSQNLIAQIPARQTVAYVEFKPSTESAVAKVFPYPDVDPKNLRDIVAMHITSRYINSVTFDTIRSQKKLSYIAHAAYESDLFAFSVPSSNLMMYAGTDSKKTGSQQLLAAMDDLVASIDQSIDQKNFESAKNEFIELLQYTPASFDGRLERDMSLHFFYEDPQAFEKMAVIARAFTSDDLKHTLKKAVLDAGCLNVVVMGYNDRFTNKDVQMIETKYDFIWPALPSGQTH